MRDDTSPTEAAPLLGTTPHRLADETGHVYLVPPHFTTYLASTGRGSGYHEYDLATGEALRAVTDPTPYAEVSRPSADGRRIGISTETDYRVIDIVDRREVFSLPFDRNPKTVLFAPDGRTLAAVRSTMFFDAVPEGWRSTITLHDIDGKEPAWELSAFWESLNSAAFSADGRLLAAVGSRLHEDPRTSQRGYWPEFVGEVWDLATGCRVSNFYLPGGGNYTWVGFVAGGHELLIADGDDQPPRYAYDVATGERLREYTTVPPDWDDRYDPETGEERLEFSTAPPNEEGLHAVSPFQPIFASLRHDSATVVRRDAATGAVIDVTPCPFGEKNLGRDARCDLAFRPDGTLVALGVFDQMVFAWTMPDGRKLTRHVGSQG